jgi:microcystin-dependent protein
MRELEIGALKMPDGSHLRIRRPLPRPSSRSKGREHGGDFTPIGWQLCAGQLMPINQNLALFSLLGTTFGGNGETDFALPDLRSHAPVSGANYIIAVEGTFPSRI